MQALEAKEKPIMPWEVIAGSAKAVLAVVSSIMLFLAGYVFKDIVAKVSKNSKDIETIETKLNEQSNQLSRIETILDERKAS